MGIREIKNRLASVKREIADVNDTLEMYKDYGYHIVFVSPSFEREVPVYTDAMINALNTTLLGLNAEAYELECVLDEFTERWSVA